MRKSAKQLDADIAGALAKRSVTRKPRPEVVALFEYLADEAEVYGRENLFYARREEGYTGDPKEFRSSDIWAKRMPDYKHTLLVDYIDEASRMPHKRLGRALSLKETEWMQREASTRLDADRRALREAL